jgi:hypothetical protein
VSNPNAKKARPIIGFYLVVGGLLAVGGTIGVLIKIAELPDRSTTFGIAISSIQALCGVGFVIGGLWTRAKFRRIDASPDSQ